MVRSLHALTLGAVLPAVLALSPGLARAQEDAPPAADEAATDAFADIDATLSRGDWTTAAERAHTLLQDPSAVDTRSGAWARVGKALQEGGFRYAALVAYGQSADLDTLPLAPFYDDLLRLTEDLDEHLWMGTLIGNDFSVPMDEGTRAHVALISARHAFEEASWGTALGLLPLVGERSTHHLDAQVLRGVTLAQQARYGDALVPLLGAYEQAKRSGRSSRYVNTLARNVARTFFATGNFGRAMEYYGKVDRSDPAWLDAQFERAWAHFRVDDVAGTLGLLHTHGSPFFESFYYPEADLLRAQSLYLMCKFPDATKAIDAFQARYQPITEELATLLGTLSPADAFDEGVAWLDDVPTRVPLPLMRTLDTDRRFADAVAAVAVADEEIERLRGLSTEPFADLVVDTLQARRDARVQAEGQRLLDRWQAARVELDEMLSGIELTRIDLLTFEADLYSRAAASGERIEYEESIERLRKFRKKGKQVWPFEGEYWADELGWYRIDTTPDCPAKLQRGE